MKIEHRNLDSKHSIDNIMDTLQLIKLAHDNNIQCEQIIGEKLIATLKNQNRYNDCPSDAEQQKNNHVSMTVFFLRISFAIFYILCRWTKSSA